MSARRSDDESGAALLITLLMMLLLAATAAALVSVSSIETLLGAAQRHAQETASAADAALERALHDLGTLSDWSPVLSAPPANVMSSFVDGRLAAAAPDGRTLDLARLTADRQRDSDLHYGPLIFGADSPQWRLYAHAPFADVLPAGAAAPPAYLLVWVADDGGDGDGDPTVDANGRLLVHAEAYGSGGARRAVEAAISRFGGSALQVVAWREISH